MSRTVRIAGASGMWGDWAGATAQLLADGVDYLVYDYLAEITMSILARAKAKDPQQGYATDFVTSTLRQNLSNIAKTGTKVLSNAGGVNVDACADAVRELIRKVGLDLKVAVVRGDNLLDQRAEFAGRAPQEMFVGTDFPAADSIASINAYLGAGPVRAALESGADIVITGRCADSALSLAACMHAFDWAADDWNKLAAGSLVGHLLECGPQATGGNYTDWQQSSPNLETIGYPIAEVEASGEFVITKPAGTGGLVTVGTVSEQMLYEIEDPQNYLLPDVIADFSAVTLTTAGEDRVRVANATGRPCTHTYKVSTTYADGYRIGILFGFCGFDASAKARRFGEAALNRARAVIKAMGAPDYRDTSIEVIGAEDQYGAFAQNLPTREVYLKMAVWHDNALACGLLLREMSGMGLATPPGLTPFNYGRPKPQPVVRLFSFLLDKSAVQVEVQLEDEAIALPAPVPPGHTPNGSAVRPAPPATPQCSDAELAEVPLIQLAYARSGDKGNRANIGIIARKPEYALWIWSALTESVVAERFAHFLEGEVTRYWLPGSQAINFVLTDVLGGGGVASLRNDPQGKAYGQILLATPIRVPATLLEQ